MASLPNVPTLQEQGIKGAILGNGRVFAFKKAEAAPAPRRSPTRPAGMEMQQPPAEGWNDDNAPF
jgi:hypothetical protein